MSYHNHDENIIEIMRNQIKSDKEKKENQTKNETVDERISEFGTAFIEISMENRELRKLLAEVTGISPFSSIKEFERFLPIK